VLSEVTRTSELSIKSFTAYPVSKHGKVASARIYSAGLAYNNLSLNGTRTSDRYLAHHHRSLRYRLLRLPGEDRGGYRPRPRQDR